MATPAAFGLIPVRIRDRWWVMAAISAFVLLSILTYLESEEDAFIYYRYAWNWVHGLGLVFNPGELVEGFSSPVWMLFIALLGRVGFYLPRAAPALGIVCGALTLMATYYLARTAGLDRWGRLASVWGVALAYPFIVWARSGLDTPWYTLVLVLFVGTYLAAEHPLASPVTGRTRFLALLLLPVVAVSRPEGVLLAIPVLIDRWRSGRDGRGAWRYLAALGFGVGLLLVWRYVTFGALLPNTSVKIHPEYIFRSSYQLVTFATYFAGLLVLVPLIAWLRHRLDRRLSFIVLVVLLVTVLYQIITGGDQKWYFRFCVPALPLWMVLFWGSLAGLFGERVQGWAVWRRRVLYGGLLVLILATSMVDIGRVWQVPQVLARVQEEWTDPYASIEHLPFSDRAHVVMARWIADNVPDGAVVAYGQMGKAPYYALQTGRQIRFIDTLGLTDRTIGQLYGLPSRVGGVIGALRAGDSFATAVSAARHDLANRLQHYLLDERRPDLIIVESRFADDLFMAALLSSEQFRQDYVLVAAVPPGPYPYAVVYSRRANSQPLTPNP